MHHGYYEPGVKPWEYPNESLFSLCGNGGPGRWGLDECHGKAEWIRHEIYKELGKMHPRHHTDVLGILKQLSAWIREKESLSGLNLDK